MAKDNVFGNIAQGITAPIGGAIRGVARGLFPGAAKAADVKYETLGRQKDMQQLQLMMSMMKDPGSNQQVKKAASDTARRILFRYHPEFENIGAEPMTQRGGWGGAMGGLPTGMIPTKVEVGKEGLPSYTFEPKERFGNIPGAYGLVPEEKRAGIAEQALVKPVTQVNIGEQRQITNTLALRREFQSDQRIKDMREIDKFTDNVVSAYERSLTSKNLGPVDISLAKSFQKLTDLGSAVREGEFATTFAGQKLINKVIGKVQSFVKGGLGFTPEDRKEIKDLVLILQKDSQKMYNQAYDEFSTTADEFKFNKRAIFGGTKKYDLGKKEPDVYIQHPFRTDRSPTAVNPKTGQRLILINNKWVPANKEK